MLFVPICINVITISCCIVIDARSFVCTVFDMCLCIISEVFGVITVYLYITGLLVIVGYVES